MNHYLCVGAGGTATYLLPGLYRYLRSVHGEDNFSLGVVDGDSVEVSNLDRQAHDFNAVGMNKAEALAARFPGVIPIKNYLGPDNIERLIQEGTTVIITVDNFPCRARIQQRANELDNVTVINAGNEEYTGSVQLWVREDGKDITPPIGFMHPEINFEGPDRAAMTCAQVAALPGGGQTTLANMTAANWILTALNHKRYAPSTELRWHEVHFDAITGTIEPLDYRGTKAWSKFLSSAQSSPTEQDASASGSG